MNKAPDLRETIPTPNEVAQAALDGNLALFVGAGVSRLVGLPSWTELASLALEDLRKAGLLNYSELDQLTGQDPKKLLSIAKLITEENGIDLDLVQHLNKTPDRPGIYDSINSLGCFCVTTNYDLLLAPKYQRSDNETPSTKRIWNRRNFFAKLLDEPGTVVHLHGCTDEPTAMVVSTREYLEHYDNENVQGFLGELFQKKTVVFLGYGLEEAEVLEHILRRGSVRQTGERKRFALQGFFASQQPLYENLHSYYDKSFGVTLLGFIRDHDDYGGLESTIRSWVGQLTIQEPPLDADLKFMNEVLRDG